MRILPKSALSERACLKVLWFVPWIHMQYLNANGFTFEKV